MKRDPLLEPAADRNAHVLQALWLTQPDHRSRRRRQGRLFGRRIGLARPCAGASGPSARPSRDLRSAAVAGGKSPAAATSGCAFGGCGRRGGLGRAEATPRSGAACAAASTLRFNVATAVSSNSVSLHGQAAVQSGHLPHGSSRRPSRFPAAIPKQSARSILCPMNMSLSVAAGRSPTTIAIRDSCVLGFVSNNPAIGTVACGNYGKRAKNRRPGQTVARRRKV